MVKHPSQFSKPYFTEEGFKQEDKHSLFNLPKFGDGPSPQRILYLCEKNLHELEKRDILILKVTGSNGKGSTVAFMESLGTALGLKTGALSSPHMFDPCERIRVDGTPISQKDWETSQTHILMAISEYEAKFPNDRFCQSDALLALALDIFVREGCELICLEAGLGGRLDPIRYVSGRHVALTSIDLEHCEALGHREDMILSEKIELCPDQGFLTAPLLQDDLTYKLMAWAKVRNLKLPNIAPMLEAVLTMPMRLLGAHQRRNAAVAFTAIAECLKSANRWPGDTEFLSACKQSAEKTALSGRLSRKVVQGVSVWLDAAHTPKGMRAYSKALQSLIPPNGCVLLIGASSDKCLLELLAPIAAVGSILCCVEPTERGAPVQRIEETMRSLRPSIQIHNCSSVGDGLRFALHIAQDHAMPLCIAGGLFLAREAEAELKQIERS